MADLNWTESTGFVMEVVLVSDLKLWTCCVAGSSFLI
jgi:hypothetical protein